MPVELHREFSKANRLAGHHKKFHLSSFVSNPIAVIDISRIELCCPFVGHLLRRLTYGVYYDLIKLDSFANNVGYAFEDCVGNIIKLLSLRKWNVYAESINGKKEPKSSCDWIIVEDDIGVFIECKFKRPLVDTKSDPSNEGAFERDLFHYAKFCAQAIMAAEREHAGLFGRDVPKGAVYIIIVTPEDWLILNGVIGAKIRKMCTEELRRKGSDPKLVEKYSIINMGCSSFSLFIQAAAHFSLTEVLISHSSDAHLNDFTPGFVMNNYSGRDGFRPQKLWREDFDRLIDLDQFRPEKI
ncbi:hypothetical protein GCM10007417_19490 [Glycocaulis alkaliphilus]|nr:hypothetical protein GCM10007417_19490 [Glycocaulis alkaliphilus]